MFPFCVLICALQAAEVGFQHSFLTSTYSAGPLLLGALYPLLSLGLSASAVANYVQSGGARIDDLDSTLHKRLNAGLSTFSVAQLALLVSQFSNLFTFSNTNHITIRKQYLLDEHTAMDQRNLMCWSCLMGCGPQLVTDCKRLACCCSSRLWLANWPCFLKH